MRKTFVILILLFTSMFFSELVIITEPSAMVYWNDKLIDVVPLNGILKISNLTYPGKLKIVKPGYSIYETLVSTESTLNVSLSLPSYVEITTDPENVKIYINGKFYGLSPSVFEVPAGFLEIHLEKEGFISKTLNLHVGASKIEKINVKLKRFVKLRINASEKLNVIFNGKYLTIPTELEVLPGKYVLELLDPEFVKLKQEIDVPNAEEYEFNVDETKFSKLYVYGFPENAEIIFNSISKVSPANFKAMPGDYEITIRSEGYKELKKKINLKSGNNTYVYNLKRNVISKINENLLVFLDGIKASNLFVAKRLYFTKIVGKNREWYGFTDGSIEKMPESYSIILGREGAVEYKGIRYNSPAIINARFGEILTFISDDDSTNFTVVNNLIIDDEEHCVVNVYSKDKLDVYVDDKFIGRTPIYFLVLPKGMHKFRFQKEGIIVSENKVIIQNGILNEVFGGD
ncbi:hypothetical protein BG95_08185 [Thermosipho sp. 1063]|uniref:PEGA domain-containing protein n=1 Tax=unclassified Thermosipho (in: thermotogales) TaxID=2676525 RepID=UPI0009492E6D|nr:MULTISPECIES: PEGA domain-containing protein [unclassified Thermosipho (in: thermotogales)]ANQ54385.1 hypothetical protein Y592_08270 [Thermosipho sp. 1070]APT72830.1 hypothetical protein BG95_08185 [Thermosipho sp. 1063]